MLFYAADWRARLDMRSNLSLWLGSGATEMRHVWAVRVLVVCKACKATREGRDCIPLFHLLCMYNIVPLPNSFSYCLNIITTKGRAKVFNVLHFWCRS